MFVRSVLSSYSKLLAGVSLALMAVSLAGCNDTVAEKAEPPRPVLVATAHYDAETPERSFVGTVRPRIALGSIRVAGLSPPHNHTALQPSSNPYHPLTITLS